MTPTVVISLLFGLSSAVYGKYVIEEKLMSSWTDAQKFCRENFTGLAPINNEKDTQLVQNLPNGAYFGLWFGLMKNTTSNTWVWSEGGEVQRCFWGYNQPNGHKNEDYGMVQRGKWHDVYLYHYNNHNYNYPGSSALCFKVHLVKQPRAWEEAMEHCRDHHGDLASISSEEEMRLLQKEVQKGQQEVQQEDQQQKEDQQQELVWVGLRFLAGRWFWTDGQEPDYGLEDLSKCPSPDTSCAALRDNVMVPHDCLSELPFLCY